jgi:hypothetical protein
MELGISKKQALIYFLVRIVCVSVCVCVCVCVCVFVCVCECLFISYSCVANHPQNSNYLLQPLWKKIWRLLKNPSIDLTHDPAIPLLGIYPKECDSGYSRCTCRTIFTAVLFTIAKLWEQPRCPTTDQWIKKM